MIAKLDCARPNWRKKYILLLDNCPAHTSQASVSVMKHLRIPVFFSAPASYIAIPVEGVFAALKAKELDLLPVPNLNCNML
jgi:transposase